MKLPTHMQISSDLIKKILAKFPTKIYKVNSPLFYEGQIPISGYLILDGSIQISKKKFTKILNAGTLLGVKELMLRKPISVSAEVFPNTEICYLDQSTIHDLCQEDDSDLATFFKEYMKVRP